MLEEMGPAGLMTGVVPEAAGNPVGLTGTKIELGVVNRFPEASVPVIGTTTADSDGVETSVGGGCSRTNEVLGVVIGFPEASVPVT